MAIWHWCLLTYFSVTEYSWYNVETIDWWMSSEKMNLCTQIILSLFQNSTHYSPCCTTYCGLTHKCMQTQRVGGHCGQCVSLNLRLAVARSSGGQELLAPLYYYYRYYYYGCYCKPRKHPGSINKENMQDGLATDNHRGRGEEEKKIQD